MCAVGVETSAVRTLCRQLKYLDGAMKNGQGEQQRVCSSYKGEDYCGPEPQKIHFMGLKCEPGQTDIWDCYRELADGCDHT